ncbi:conserved protein, unknown function [Plasmodium knowlesi strain H]|uniref:Transmembrane protein 234 n=3 Tax=Plasmodium knowlesi TaxID=5850 RepID=A0A5E7X2K7_PLAKH|nr:transmembrane protein 234, putative [Plasmodium knowlesi strain H]OTN64391.1 Uncharacterized protein PKNOH_S130204200 [Plasmodium knowlesi]CAA9989202.1 transmembrane protein 234, putative [Plasmodium knowlesi strain H]SBO27295.1 conserved protein, unknown function [Plasmodium knowlesi strain H]SBO27425.1 conserved protein, unknown function [Plasmodium knowlesi strain H]VVS78676.1 transmembrane protein 234, putative [Plasmodium knowlesi strain H]
MQLALYLLVGILWGCTNAFMKRGCSRRDEEKEKGLLRDTIDILKNWYVVIPYLFNQAGSALYYYLLRKADISLVMPLCNILSFFFTFLTEMILLKKTFSFKSVLGLSFVSVGLFLCLGV